MVPKINKNLDDLYNDVASDNYNVIEITKENSIYDSTITFDEYLKILYLMVMNNLILDKYPNFGSSKLDKLFDFTLKYIEKITKSQSNDWEEKLKQYGFIIFGFSHNNKTIPFDIYCRKICKNVYQQYFGEPYDNN